MDVLRIRYIKIPTGNQAMEIVCRFEERWDFLQCFAAINGSYIPTIPPHDSPTD